MTKRRITVRGIIFKNGKILSQQLTPDHYGVARDFWCTPGGGLEDNESLVDGLTREMIEETGVTPNIGKLLFIQQFTDDGCEQLEFFFHISNADDYEIIDLFKTSHGITEIKNVGFINPKENNILPSFLQTIDIQNYTTNTQAVCIFDNLPN